MNTQQTSPLARLLRRIAPTFLLAMLSAAPWAARAAEDISESARTQIAALLAEKDARTPAQRKMDSQLVYFAKKTKSGVAVAAAPSLAIEVRPDVDNRVLVDVKATVSAELRSFIIQSGGVIVSEVAAFDAIRVLMPATMLESLAARSDVRFVEPAAEATTNVGSVLSQGDRTHRAVTARTTLGVDGTGIKIGVLSDGVNSLATSKASGNLNANATFLTGQAGSGDEGTAMMELIQDLLPGAQLIFATAFSGTASMASNIQALQAAGCSVIVDDVTYFNESPFQDQIISQAVTTVSNAGAMYFSSARNSGNKNDGTAGTWEGDFADGGVAGAPVTTAGNLHDFGGGTTFDTVASGGSSRRVDLFWADPVGGSTNDYDLFVLDSTGATVLRSSTNIQSGTQDPYESTGTLNIGERIVIVKKTGAAARFLHLDTGRAVLTLSTPGNVRGHNASGAANAFSVAATNVANSPSPNFFVGGATNPVETFSSDGPRRLFFDASGTAITPGNFTSTGGTVLNKPDITAADGASTSVTGFTSFFGTSAAAPHAAAIAAMVRAYKPSLTPAQVRTLMTSTALDIEAAGLDRDSGSGIVMALEALQATAAPDVLTIAETGLDASGTAGGPFTPSSGTYTLTNTSGSPVNWTVASTQNWNTVSPASGTLAAGNSVVVTCAFNANTNALAAGNYIDTVTITNTGSGFSRNLSVTLAVAVLQVAPTVTTPTQTGIGGFGATLGGNVTSDGNATITERGVVYAVTTTNADPLIGGTGVTKVTGTGTTGVFTVNVSGLSQSTGYSFKAYATNSVGTSYTTPASTFTTTTAVALTGTKTIGAGGDFTSLTNTGGLFEAINGNGVNGLLTVQVIGNLTAETGAVPLSALAGTSPSVKIFPTGTARVISGSIAGALITLNGADNVTIDGSLGGTGTDRSLTITNTNTANPTAISLASLGTGLGATNNTIKNCNINTGVATAIGYGISVGGSTPGTNGADNDNVTIQNNSITAAPIGLFASGTSSGSAGGDDNLSIIGNSIDYNSTLASVGIRVGNALNSSVSQNTVSEQTSVIQAPTAISIETGFVSSTVTRNTVTKSLTTNTGGYAGRGITVGTGTSASALTIANNIIYGVNGSNWSAFTDSSATGIMIGTINNSATLTTVAGGVNLYYNSVNMTGSMGSGSSTAITAAIYIGSGASALDLRNNVFVNTQVATSVTQKNYAIYSAAASTAFTNIDYNDYFVSNTFNAASAIPGFLTSDRTNLAGLQTGFGQNTHSFIGDPLFVSATNLHLASAASPASNTGTPIATVLVDFDGETRSGSTPDVGADELVGITSPAITTPTQSGISATTSALGGNVTSDGGAAITERGVVYSVTATNSDPLIGGSGVTKLTSAGTTGVFTVNATSLTAGAGYYFKAYATNSVGTTYTSPVSTFTQGVPIVTTPTSASITTNSAILGGNVTSDGGSAITERGVVYATTSVNGNPLIGGSGVTKLTSAGTTGVFTVNATGLTSGTAYSFKAYATNSVGTTYTSPVSTFSTSGSLVFSNFMDATTVVGKANFTDLITTVSQTVTNRVSACAVSATGKLATCEQSGRVLIWNTIPTTNGAAADVVVGKPNFTTTTQGVSAALMNNCGGIAFSTDGSKLIVADYGNNRVLIWNTVPTSNGQPADVVIGQTDFVSNTTGTSATKLNGPDGIFVTPSGKMLLADNTNNRVLIYNSIPTSNGAAADFVIGQANMTTATTGSAANQLGQPWKAVMSGDGRVLVADSINNRVVVFNTLPTSNGASADVVIGQSAFGASTVATTATGMSNPLGVAVSGSGQVAVSEFSNHRVLIFNSIPTTNGAAANFVLGQPDFTSATLSNGGISAHSMNTAYQAAFTSDGRLLVPGTQMARVMIFGSASSFTAPIVTTPTSTGITVNSATLGGNVTSDGGAAITERGVVYSISTANADPLIGGTGVTKLTSAGTTGAFTVNATGLTAGTGYSFKAYATNSMGTTYTTPVSTFTTTAAPTVTSLNRGNSSPSNAATVNWTLTFSSAVSGVTAGNFSLSGTATAGAAVGTPTTADGGLNWNVPVTTGASSGTLTLNLANSTGQSPTVSTALPFGGQSYTMDKTTQTPTLTAPATSAIVSNPITATFSLPETALAGSVKLIFTGAASRTLTLAASQETSGAHSFSFNPASPTSAAQVASITGGASIPDGVYTVTLSYQDTLANAASTAASTNVTIDTATQSPTLTAPATNAVTSSPVVVTFSLPETALAGSVKLIFTGAASRTLTLAASQETSGAHSFSFNPASPTSAAQVASITGGTSIPNGLYTVTLSYQDLPANAPATAASSNIRIDTAPPTLNLPAPIVVTATGPSGAVVNYTATASDPGGSGVASSNFTPASGSTFPIGTTTVNATATDNAGNSANGSFTITVTPNPPPTGGTFAITPNTGVHQGDPLTLTAAGWTDTDLPLTYQFFLGVTPLNTPGPSSTLGINAPAPGSDTLKVRVTDSAGSFTDVTQPLTVVDPAIIESWREFYFGSPANSGNGADTADPDGDGLVNLVEFAFGTDPTNEASGPPALQYTGTFAGSGTVTLTGQPIMRFESILNGIDFRALFVRRVNFAAAGLTYIVEFSATLATWVPSGATPTVLATDGTVQIVSMPYPPFVGGKKARFFRLRVIISP